MRKGLAFAALDLMGSLLLVVFALINPPVTEARSAIETHGRWVVVMTWEASDNDLDLWLGQPDGNRVFWLRPRSSVAHLEQDDLGYRSDDEGDNWERLVIRSAQPGEYSVSGHAYAAYDLPIRVTVTLWRLQGADKKVYTREATFTANGMEISMFRFSLSKSGALTDLNNLPARIVAP